MRLDIDRQNLLEPKRIEFAKKELEKLGYEVAVREKEIFFLHNFEVISLFPYSGWFSGKGIGSGRGLNKLIKKLKETKL